MPAKSVYGLTAKQEEFSVAVAGGKSQSDAYRQAYDAENMTPSQIWVESSTLAKNPKVADRIAFLRNSVASETILKAADILNETRRMASVTARDFVHPDGTVKGIHELSDDAAACVSAITSQQIKNKAIKEAIGKTKKQKPLKNHWFSEQIFSMIGIVVRHKYSNINRVVWIFCLQK